MLMLRNRPGLQAKVARTLGVSAGQVSRVLVGQDDLGANPDTDSKGGETWKRLMICSSGTTN